jgi:hypothetical protein
MIECHNVKAFVETGTFKGNTTKWASNYFEKVYTIEKSEVIFNLYSNELKTYNIHTYFGDSRDILPLILPKIENETTLFWLDGHFMGGNTAGADDPCPLMGELAIILSRKNEDIILIDDARLFSTLKRVPKYPTIIDIMDLTTSPYTDNCRQPVIQPETKKLMLYVCEDVIFIIPDKQNIRNILTEYILEKDIENEEIKRLYALKGFFKRFIMLLKNIFKKLGIYYYIQNIYYKWNKYFFHKR